MPSNNVTNHYLAPTKPTLLTPGNGASVGGSGVIFKWKSGTLDVSDYRLTVGATVDGTDYHDTGNTSDKTATVDDIPFNGASVYATLYYTNSGITNKLNYIFLGAVPTIKSPANLSVAPKGILKLEWYPRDVASSFSVNVVGNTTNAVYLNIPDTADMSMPWSPPIGATAVDKEFTLTVVWKRSGETVTTTFSINQIPDYDRQIGQGLTPPLPTVFTLVPDALKSTETLTFPTTINLFRDGKESRFTTSEIPLISQSFKCSLLDRKQLELLSYIRRNGRGHTWLPMPSHTLCGTLEGNRVKTLTDLSWAWLTSKYMLVHYTRSDSYMIVKIASVQSKQITADITAFSQDNEKVLIIPCLVQVPDFTGLSHAGQKSSSVQVTGANVPLDEPTNSLPIMGTLINGRRVLPIMSPFSSRKFTQLIEATVGGHYPKYYPVGKQAVDLSSYTFSWGTIEQLNALVGLFLEIKGAQDALILTDYSQSLVFVKQAGGNTHVKASSETELVNIKDYRYVVVTNNGDAVSVHEVVSVVSNLADNEAVLTLNPPLAGLETSCEINLHEGILSRLTTSSITLNYLTNVAGTCSLSFTEVVK